MEDVDSLLGPLDIQISKLKVFFLFLLGSTKANGRELYSCLGWIFHFKLVSFVDINEVNGANACLCLKLNENSAQVYLLKSVHVLAWNRQILSEPSKIFLSKFINIIPFIK